MRQAGVVVLGALLALASAAQAETRPNVLVVLLDDFGVGQFAPLLGGLSENDMDPAFVKFVGDMTYAKYSPAEALSAEKKAMLSRFAAEHAAEIEPPKQWNRNKWQELKESLNAK